MEVGGGLPYRPLGTGISSPDLVVETCLEACCTCHRKSCGHFQGEKMEERGGVTGSMTESGSSHEREKEKKGNTEILVNKISRILCPE